MTFNGMNTHVRELFCLLGCLLLFSHARASTQWTRVEDSDTSALDVRALAVAPDGTLFAGTIGQGIWRSADGREWEPVNTGLGSLNVGELAVAPDGTVFAGTIHLEGPLPDSLATPGDGLYRSVNGGGLWTKILDTDYPDTHPYKDFHSVSALAVSGGGRAFASFYGDGGSFHRSDDGIIWEDLSPGFFLALLALDNSRIVAAQYGHVEAGEIVRSLG